MMVAIMIRRRFSGVMQNNKKYDIIKNYNVEGATAPFYLICGL